MTLQAGSHPALYTSWMPNNAPNFAGYSGNENADDHPDNTWKTPASISLILGWRPRILRDSLTLRILLLLSIVCF